MDFESVKKLADLMEERGLSKVEVCEGENKISLSKEVAVAYTAAALPPAAPAQSAGGPGAGAAAPEAQAQPGTPAGEPLTSPLVGVTYLAPAPGAKPFVAEGDKVKQGQTLCIVEAMKVMNEFTAPRDGEISAVCVGNEELVEFGQPLFYLV